jgi:tRNA pseudouridine38-40 synthase
VRTVAGVLEAALSALFDEAVKVTGAGRTDSGVHATGQVVSLSTGSRFPFDRLELALHGILARDCSVRDVAVVAEDFSARFCAQERTYVYAIRNRGPRSALVVRYAHHVAQPLDLRAMQAAAEPLLGEHDFRAFAAAAAGEPTVRRLRRIAIEPRGDLVRIEVAADGFLHHMVRTIVGTLLECGLGRRDAGDVAGILRGRDRNAAGSTAPALGLYLAGVRYPDGYNSFADPPIFSQPKAARVCEPSD